MSDHDMPDHGYAAIPAEGFMGHKPLPNGKCEHRWRNRQTKAVTCRFADGWHAGQVACRLPPTAKHRREREVVRVRVSYVVDADDDFRMAICHQWGECGRLATREEIKRYRERVGEANDDDLMQEWRDCDTGCQPPSKGA